MEWAIEEFPEYSDKTTDWNIDNYEASINNYEVSKILELDVPLERVKENMKHIEHIEHIVESYIDFLENKEINEYLNKNTEWLVLKK